MSALFAMNITEGAVGLLCRIFDDPAKNSKQGVGSQAQVWTRHFWLGFGFRQAPSNPLWALRIHRDYAGGPAHLVVPDHPSKGSSGKEYRAVLIYPLGESNGECQEEPKPLAAFGPYWQKTDPGCREVSISRGPGFVVRAPGRSGRCSQATVIGVPGETIAHAYHHGMNVVVCDEEFPLVAEVG
jgi:hypothetical protein